MYTYIYTYICLYIHIHTYIYTHIIYIYKCQDMKNPREADHTRMARQLRSCDMTTEWNPGTTLWGGFDL